MSKKVTKNRRKAPVTHAGRVTITECKVRGQGRPCAPVNRLTIYRSDGSTRDHGSCSCGRQFTARHPDMPDHLVDLAGPPDGAEVEGATFDPADVLPSDAEEPGAARGVVPVGTAVLHAPTQAVGPITTAVTDLAKHMVRVMIAAPGVGLAANQVGVPVRMFVHIHNRAAPETIIDPEIRAVEGVWQYPEGCLSVQLDDTRAVVDRPARIQVRARTLHGDVVEITASEVLARVFQHEIDHLDGITYVQRLGFSERTRVYALLEEAGVETLALPARRY